MADVTRLLIPITAFVGDSNAQLVVGDNPATFVAHNDAPAYAFDDTDEEAIVSTRLFMPTQYAAGTLKAKIGFYTAGDSTNDLALDVFVEAITAGDTSPDMEAATGWGSANSGTVSVSADTAAGELNTITITLSNKDSIAAGDVFRLGIRRDCDSANDDIVGDVYICSVELLETE